jgi:hypothetical protein
MRAMRSARTTASSWSWVTKTVVQDELAHLLPQVGVERAEGLVEEQKPWFGDEGARERHPLLLAAGEFFGGAVGGALHAHAPQGFPDLALRLLPRCAAHLEAEPDVAGDAHVRKEERLLEDHRGLPPLGRGADHGAAPDPHVARGGAQEAGHDL